MKIKVSNNNLSALQAALDEAQGTRAKARLFYVEDLISLVEKHESTLIAQEIPKKFRSGISISVTKVINVGTYAKKAYSAESTQVILTRGSDAWFLTGVSRISINPRHERAIHVTIPEETKKYIYETSVKKFEERF